MFDFFASEAFGFTVNVIAIIALFVFTYKGGFSKITS
jgi:hypothetical protein